MNDKGILAAADLRSLTDLQKLTRAIYDVPGIDGLKVGMTLVSRFGLPAVAQTIREVSTKMEIIWDYQKAGCDIPDLGVEFAAIAVDANVNHLIIFPEAGPATAEAWIEACQAEQITVALGLHMTHAKFMEGDGGWILDKAPAEALNLALEMGIEEFVFPGNKVEFAAKYYKQVSADGRDVRILSPGLVKQGGKIGEIAGVVGDKWTGIVGRALTELIGEDQEVITARAQELVSQIAA